MESPKIFLTKAAKTEDKLMKLLKKMLKRVLIIFINIKRI